MWYNHQSQRFEQSFPYLHNQTKLKLCQDLTALVFHVSIFPIKQRGQHPQTLGVLLIFHLYVFSACIRNHSVSVRSVYSQTGQVSEEKHCSKNNGLQPQTNYATAIEYESLHCVISIHSEGSHILPLELVIPQENETQQRDSLIPVNKTDWQMNP